MIKKLLMACVAIAATATAASARNTYAHDASALPTAAQTVLKNNFKSDVSVIKIDKDFGKISEYEVILTDGTQITFDKNGNWEDIEVARDKAVPEKLIPEGIVEFVKKNQPKQKVIGIDKERSGYEVELTNGVDIKFDKQGNFVRYDD